MLAKLGNGYLGLRSATEEQYRGETRDLLVAGSFDRFSEEVTELPNAADVTNIEITLFALEGKAGQKVVLEKFSNVFTSRDKELAVRTKNEIQAHAKAEHNGYEGAQFPSMWPTACGSTI